METRFTSPQPKAKKLLEQVSDAIKVKHASHRRNLYLLDTPVHPFS